MAARLAVIIAQECGVPLSETKKVHTAVVLHDIGKLRIPKSILYKPGKLTAQEFEIMKTHTKLGAEMLKSVKGDLGEMARHTALYHHEHWDGNGYWGKLAGELPYYVPLATIADVFTALVCERVYKRAWPPEEALAYIQAHAGAIFSPALVDVFLPLAQNDGRLRDIYKEEMK